ncbi:MAG: type II toxin-antitoxin system RelE/ParE family toxin [Gallionellaceae bacterium]|jgi:plasmid stabilization system protein ParE|nr:type II toxin-antitoxin system RelE/ParE family toxin [Gallionellaceae bacterium]
MPRIIITEGAATGLERCRLFLAGKSPEAAQRASQAIADALLQLETTPNMGRPAHEWPEEFRELIIDFGDSGYIALYRHQPTDNAVYVLAFRHQKEAGY